MLAVATLPYAAITQSHATITQMNDISYRVANAAAGHEAGGFGFEGEYFEVRSPPIRSRYAGVVWRVLPPVTLPEEVISAYNGSVMAVTGFEVDVVRVAPDGKVTRVPNYQSYNHHYVSILRGAGVTLPAEAIGRPNVHGPDGLPFAPVEGHPDATLSAGPLGVAPSVQAFNEHNGNEACPRRASNLGRPGVLLPTSVCVPRATAAPMASTTSRWPSSSRASRPRARGRASTSSTASTSRCSR